MMRWRIFITFNLPEGRLKLIRARSLLWSLDDSLGGSTIDRSLLWSDHQPLCGCRLLAYDKRTKGGSPF